MTVFLEYRGMSAKQASQEGLMLVEKAAANGNWLVIVDRLLALQRIVKRAV